MSKSRLVETTFQSGPDDGLAAVDVYKKDTSEVVNSYDATEPEAIDVLDSLNGKADESNKDEPPSDSEGNDDGSSNPEGSDSSGNDDPFESLNPDTSDREITDSELVDRLTEGDQELGQCLRDLDDKTLSKLDIPKTSRDSIFGDFGGIKAKLPSKVPLPSVKSVATMVNNLSKGNYPAIIQDVGSKTNLIGSLTNIASALKLPDAFSKIAEYSGISTSILVDAAKQGINSSLARGDLGAFKDVAKSSVASRMKYVIPNISNKAIRALEKPVEVDLRNYSDFYDDTTKALDKMDSS